MKRKNTTPHRRERRLRQQETTPDWTPYAARAAGATLGYVAGDVGEQELVTILQLQSALGRLKKWVWIHPKKRICLRKVTQLINWLIDLL